MDNYADIENLDWYHTIELKPGYFTRGRYDWRPYLNQFDFGNLDGKTVLDIGCGNGFFSFYFEKLGASVTALDIPSQKNRDCNMVGINNVRVQPKYEKDHINFKDPFNIAKEMLNSNVKRIEMDLYDMTPENGGKYDLIFCSDVLLHLTDPFKALNIFKKICNKSMIISTPIHISNNPLKRLGYFYLKNEPISYFMGDRNNGAFWIPSITCLKCWLQGAGFTINRTHKFHFKKKHGECVMPRLIINAGL